MAILNNLMAKIARIALPANTYIWIIFARIPYL